MENTENNETKVELTKQEELAAARLAGTAMGKLCLFGAKVFKGTGIVLEKSTSVTATGLRMAANGIQGAGAVSSQFCYTQSDKLQKKSDSYNADTAETKAAQDKINEILKEMGAKGVKPTFAGVSA